jgi:hypothetical protein
MSVNYFTYFLKSAVDDQPLDKPICSDFYYGEIGDFVEIDGIGYIITDYAEEILDEEVD